MIGTAPHPHGDELDDLAREHASAVFRYLRSLLGDGETARDLVQETFLRLHRHAADAGPGLVFATARSCALDHLRRLEVRRRHETAAGEGTWTVLPGDRRDRPDHALETRRLQDDLLAALAILPEDQRTVFHLSEIEGRPYVEIAEVLGISPGTIASRKHHAVRRLRAHLGRLGHGK